MILLAGIVSVGLGGGCPLKGDDGDDGLSGSSGTPGTPGQDALISFNSYQFIPTANPGGMIIPEISLTGVEAGWQAVTVWMFATTLWHEIPMSIGDGTTYEIDHVWYPGDGFVQVEVIENGVYNDPPVVGYQLYMVTVQTFNH